MTMQQPSRSSPARPRFWKQFVLTFAVVYPTQQVLAKGLAPALGAWLAGVSPWLREVGTVALMCLVLMKALPAAYRAGAAWLHR